MIIRCNSNSPTKRLIDILIYFTLIGGSSHVLLWWGHSPGERLCPHFYGQKFQTTFLSGDSPSGRVEQTKRKGLWRWYKKLGLQTWWVDKDASSNLMVTHNAINWPFSFYEDYDGESTKVKWCKQQAVWYNKNGGFFSIDRTNRNYDRYHRSRI